MDQLRLMAATMALFLTSLSRAGIDVSAQSGPLTDLPEGVTACNGWANRLLFGASYLWLIIAARVSWRGAWTGQSECSVSSTNRRQA
jgi:hypothetical protein